MAHSSRRRYGRHCSPPETLYTDYETRRSFYPNSSFIPMCYGLVTTVVQSCISNGGDIMNEPSPFYGLRPIKELAEEWSINYRSLYHICRRHEIQAAKIIGNSRLYGPDEQRDMFAAPLDLTLPVLAQGALTCPDTGKLLDTLQCLGEQLGPRALAQRHQIMEAVPAEDAATDLNFDAPF